MTGWAVIDPDGMAVGHHKSVVGCWRALARVVGKPWATVRVEALAPRPGLFLVDTPLGRSPDRPPHRSRGATPMPADDVPVRPVKPHASFEEQMNAGRARLDAEGLTAAERSRPGIVG